MNKKEFNRLMKRNSDSHKGENGKLLVIAGSKDLAGAALLASVSALRVGADTVTLACPEEVGKAMNCYCPDIMTIKLKGDLLKEIHYKQIVKGIEKYDAILLGNGIGMHNSTKKLANKIIKINMLKIIDADALKIIRLQDVDNAVLIPHEAEYKVLLKNSKLQKISDIRNNVILLKGKHDQIITSKKTVLNKTGNPGMAKAGTGDVLSGITAGILAKTKSLEKSAIAGAWLSGHIGDIMLKKKKGYYYIASDLIEELTKIRAL